MGEFPNKATRFPVNRKDHTKTGPYLTPLLKKLLEKKIRIEDPETQKIIKANVKHALLWRLILNGTQGETPAIKEILERIDGKVTDKTELSGSVAVTQMGTVKIDNIPLELKIG